MKKAKISIILEDLDDSEHFLRGLILAQSNNSSPYFPDLIAGVNAVLERERASALEVQMQARIDAGMP